MTQQTTIYNLFSLVDLRGHFKTPFGIIHKPWDRAEGRGFPKNHVCPHGRRLEVFCGSAKKPFLSTMGGGRTKNLSTWFMYDPFTAYMIYGWSLKNHLTNRKSYMFITCLTPRLLFWQIVFHRKLALLCVQSLHCQNPLIILNAILGSFARRKKKNHKIEYT